MTAGSRVRALVHLADTVPRGCVVPRREVPAPGLVAWYLVDAILPLAVDQDDSFWTLVNAARVHALTDLGIAYQR